MPSPAKRIFLPFFKYPPISSISSARISAPFLFESSCFSASRSARWRRVTTSAVTGAAFFATAFLAAGFFGVGFLGVAAFAMADPFVANQENVGSLAAGRRNSDSDRDFTAKKTTSGLSGDPPGAWVRHPGKRRAAPQSVLLLGI